MRRGKERERAKYEEGRVGGRQGRSYEEEENMV